MKRITTLLLFVFPFFFGYSQIVINELDCDSQGVDDMEFIELKTDTPHMALDGYVVVFFNGSNSGGDSSYFTVSLDGYTSDINGILLIGSTTVSPVPQLIISANTIQNGADAVAVYAGSYHDFPEGTLATTDNLIDALVYDTSDADDTGLMNLLGVNEQVNENENGKKDTESIQRNSDGTYTVKAPTPRRTNDGSGVNVNGITFSVAQEHYDEGESFMIDFMVEEAVSDDTTIDFSLINGGFDTADFTGATSVIIPAGTTTSSVTITLVDDSDDEGDEELLIKFDNLPEDLVPLRDQVIIRVVDNDFTTAGFGTPLAPTHGLVSSTATAGYYQGIDGLAGDQLKQAIQDIIADPEIVREQTYADIIDILKEADENPANSNQVWLVYTEQGRAKLDFQSTSDGTGKWNREHTYPRSRGGFYSIEEDEIADGKDIYVTTNADSLRHGNSDAHALRAVDFTANSTRNNSNYGEYTGPQGTAGSFYGDVARSVFYMAVRYNGLQVVNGFPADGVEGQLGDLATLLEWHRNDPPDDFEMNRNNVVENWQFNRNPFIDNPDLVEYIWGDKVGQEYTLATQDVGLAAKTELYPNPSLGQIKITGFTGTGDLKLVDLNGRILQHKKITAGQPIELNVSTGIYIVQLQAEDGKVTKKLIVR
ncbi:MAG: endonuclease I [Cytophagaceae bacterium]|nr:endonuclease I [Cytophagaceae bacterium]|tara:strand:- start:494 stop:2449 length:1956 start_codon:yes stop_codon:yes gene_type:complete